ncbi:MAG: TonB-dependent receptor [Acidobacteriota bacterium]|nr:TonB-dependent receptor [Acidobacteriota bacterium]
MSASVVAFVVVFGLVQQAASLATPAAQTPVVSESVIVQGRIGRALPLEPRLPGSFDFLGGDALRLSHPPTVNEALRRIPGVSVVDEEGLGLRPNISIRGLSPTRSSKVLLLEDGVPLAFAPYGDNASYYHPPLQRFESIEVLKGSGQIAYGPSTIGGVINYITPLPPAEPEGSFSLRAGTHSFLDGAGSFGSTRGRIGYFVNLHALTSDGARANIDTGVYDASGKTTFAAGAGQLVVARGNYYRERSTTPYSGLRASEFQENPRQNPFINDKFLADRAGASLSHHAVMGARTSVATTAYLSRFARDHWRQSNHSGQRPTDSGDPACGGMANLLTSCGNEGRLRRYVTGGLGSRASVSFGVRGELDFGARIHAEAQDREQRNGDTPAARDGRLLEQNERGVLAASGFVQHRVPLGRLSITPGVRVENVHFDRRNGLTGATGQTRFTQVVPGVGAALSLGSKALLFGGIHRGFAPPRVEDSIGNNGGVVELDPELSWNTETGVRADLGASVRFDATFFRMDYENQIVPASLAGGAGATLTNGGRTLHQGIEAGLRAERASRAGRGDSSYVRAAYTFLPVARFTGVRSSGVPGFSTVSVTGNRLPYAPRHLATVTAGYRLRTRADVFGEMVYVASQFGDDLNTMPGTADGQRGLIDAAVTWNAGGNLYLRSGRISMFVVIYNVADRIHLADRSRGMVASPPRRVSAGLRVTF